MIISFHNYNNFNSIEDFVLILSINLCIPKTDDEVKDFFVINFGDYFKSAKENLCAKLNEKLLIKLNQTLRKVFESFSLQYLIKWKKVLRPF